MRLFAMGFLVLHCGIMLHFAEIVYLYINGLQHEWSVFLCLIAECSAPSVLHHRLLDLSVVLTVVAQRSKLHLRHLTLEVIVK